MDDQLQRLLEAEAHAQALIDAANHERQRILEDALAAVRDAEARFEARRTELRTPFLNEAHARAEQAVAELSRKYGERHRTLCALAARHESEAGEAALTLLLDPTL